MDERDLVGLAEGWKLRTFAWKDCPSAREDLARFFDPAFADQLADRLSRLDRGELVDLEGSPAESAGSSLRIRAVRGETGGFLAMIGPSRAQAVLGLLARGIAHELNNAMGAISGYAALLQERLKEHSNGEPPGESDEVRYVAAIERGADRGVRFARLLASLQRGSENEFQMDAASACARGAADILAHFMSRCYEIVLQGKPEDGRRAAEPKLAEPRVALLSVLERALEIMGEHPEGGRLAILARTDADAAAFEIRFEPASHPESVTTDICRLPYRLASLR